MIYDRISNLSRQEKMTCSNLILESSLSCISSFTLMDITLNPTNGLGWSFTSSFLECLSTLGKHLKYIGVC